MKKKSRCGRDGQAMLLVILAIGGAILGATTIAGMLTLYQTRATTDAEHSAQAIVAADAGVEWSLYDYYCSATSTQNPVSRCVNPSGEQPFVSLANGATVTAACYDGTGAKSLCSATGTTASAVSRGGALNSERAFYLQMTAATQTLP